MNEITIITLLAILPLKVLVFGESSYDRLVGLSVFSNKVLVILLLLGGIYNRVGFFLDLAMGYALLNFVGIVVTTRFLRMRKQDGR
tara:strand:+ start:2334 stop:2591 length:258 start_codon:yes stop_codon:yes gene_type:complete